MKRVLAVVLLMNSVLFGGCAPATGPAPKRVVDIDEASEKRLWIRAEEDIRILDGSGFLYEDKELESYLNAVVGKMQIHATSKSLRFKVKVIKNPFLNAIAYPDGTMYVHTGMLAAMENEAQLAAILGHEMVHAINRHAAKEFSNLKARSMRRGALSATLGSFGESLGALSAMLSSNGYSRELETEADREGLRLSVKAGYDPCEALTIFEQLKRQIEEEKIKVPLVYNNHPKIQQRIANFEELLNGQYKGMQGVKNAEAFQRRAARVLLDNAELDLKRGSFARAERTVRKRLAVKPDDARAYFLLGEAYRENGAQNGVETATGHYQKAIALKPDYPDAFRALGLMQYKAGEKKDAKKNLETYLSLSPNAQDREFVQQYIREGQ